jgi:periplasmic protein TonB
MFEDSTFESTGKIRSRSRRWMIAALVLNSSILLAFIVIPLIYPEALSRQSMPFLITVPPPPVSEAPTPPHPTMHQAPGPAVEMPDPMAAPRQIPPMIAMSRGPEQPGPAAPNPGDLGGETPGGMGPVLPSQPPPRVVHPAANVPVRLPSTIAASSLIYKLVPTYPAIAKAALIQGTVVLAATISKAGTVDNLHVVSGPPMLQLAAVDAVKQWHYRPYLLNGEPVAVETTVNVVFTLQ